MTTERRIIEAVLSGAEVDLTEFSDAERRVSAAFLRRLILGRVPEARLRDMDPRGLALTGAIVQGELDLQYQTLTFPLRLRFCNLGHVLAVGVQAKEIDVMGSHFASIDLSSSSVSGDLWLSDCLCIGQLNLAFARVGGVVSLRNTEILSVGSGPDAALFLEGVKIEGSLLMNDLRIHGQLRAVSSRVTGDLELMRAKLMAPTKGGDAALRLDGSVIGGAVRLSEMDVVGQVRLYGLEARGGLSLRRSELSHPVGDQGTFDEDELMAITLERSRIGAVADLEELKVTNGQVWAMGMHIDGQLLMSNSIIASERVPSSDVGILFEGATVAADMMLDGLRVGRPIALAGVTVGGHLNLEGTTIRSSESGDYPCLTLDHARVKGHLQMGHFSCAGWVRALGIDVGGQMSVASAHLGLDRGASAYGGHGLMMEASHVAGGLFLEVAGGVPARSMRVSGSEVGFLDDTPQCWKVGSEVAGMHYSLGYLPRQNSWGVSERVAWLGSCEFSLWAYEHLAREYRKLGRDDDAAEVLIACGKRQREAGGHAWYSRLWDWVYEHAAGYGHKPARLLVGLLAMLVILVAGLFLPPVQESLVAKTTGGQVVTARDSRNGVLISAGGCETVGVSCFSPVWYAVDTLVPVVDLGQRSAWHASSSRPLGTAVEIVLNVAALLGPAFAALLAVVLSRLSRGRGR